MDSIQKKLNVYMKFLIFIVAMLFICSVQSQNIIFVKDTIIIRDQTSTEQTASSIKLLRGDTLTLGKPTKKGLLVYVYENVDKINDGAFLPIPLDDREGWKIIIEKISEKNNQIKVRGKMRKYSLNKKGKNIEIGSETAVINNLESALKSSEIILGK